ncbi:MAG: hypothetical protein IT299_07605 [Dehalococcoidia bacterium]|nr:hypothetical protein [Dehalococcoidia bacterium]
MGAAMTPDTPMPEQDERFGEHAFALLAADAPSLSADAVWARVASGVVTPAAGRPRGWWAGLVMPAPPALSGLTPLRRRAGLALAGTAALGMAVVWSLGTGGEPASAALLQSARSLSAETEAAFADGSLSDDEIVRLQGDAERLLQRILGDPAGLRALSGPDLEALTQVLIALEDRLRPGAEVAAPALRPVESAAGLATDALRVSYPALAVRFERSLQVTAATTGVQTLSAGEAGSADIDVQTGTLTVVRTSPAAGWVATVERASGREVEVEFRHTSDGRRVQLNVELEDGQLRTRLDDSRATASATPGQVGTTEGTLLPGTPVIVREEDDRTRLEFTDVTVGTNTFAAGVAGSVTISNDRSALALVGVNPSAGWTYSVDSVSPREIEVDFRGAGGRIRFNAELEDGQVRIRTETRLESSGGSSGSGSSGSGSSGSGSSGSGSSGSGSSGSGSSGSGSSESGSSGSGSSGSGSSGDDDPSHDAFDDSGRRGGRR